MSKLYFYHSVMDAGKSAHVIMQVHNLRSKGFSVLVLKPKLDTRDFGVIKSRAINDGLEAILIDDNTELFQLVLDMRPQYIYVDEVNFLSKEVIDKLANIVDLWDIPVFCYGLLTNYQSNLFEGSKRMVELADTVRELKCKCSKCHRKATMHLRKVNDKYVFEGDSIVVGDMDTYESVCRTCYMVEKDKNNKL